MIGRFGRQKAAMAAQADTCAGEQLQTKHVVVWRAALGLGQSGSGFEAEFNVRRITRQA